MFTNKSCNFKYAARIAKINYCFFKSLLSFILLLTSCQKADSLDFPKKNILTREQILEFENKSSDIAQKCNIWTSPSAIFKRQTIRISGDEYYKNEAEGYHYADDVSFMPLFNEERLSEYFAKDKYASKTECAANLGDQAAMYLVLLSSVQSEKLQSNECDILLGDSSKTKSDYDNASDSCRKLSNFKLKLMHVDGYDFYWQKFLNSIAPFDYRKIHSVKDIPYRCIDLKSVQTVNSPCGMPEIWILNLLVNKSKLSEDEIFAQESVINAALGEGYLNKNMEK